MVVKITGGKRWLVALDYPERKGEVTQYPWALLIRPPLGLDCPAIRAGSVSRSPAVDDSITAARCHTGRRMVLLSIGDN